MSRSRRRRPLAGSPPPPPGDGGGPMAGAPDDFDPTVPPDAVTPPVDAADPLPGGRPVVPPEPGLVDPLAPSAAGDVPPSPPAPDDDDDYPASGRVRVYPAPPEPEEAPDVAAAETRPAPPLPTTTQHETVGPTPMRQDAPAAAADEERRGGTTGDYARQQPYTPPLPPAAPPARSAWGPALLGGLIGAGLTAGAGYYYLNTQPFVPPVLLTRLEALEAGRPRVDTLASESATLRERTDAATSSIGTLQGRLAQVEQAGAAAPQRLQTLEQAVADLRSRLDGARATTDTIAGEVRGRVDETRARLDQLSAEVTRIARAGGDAAATGQRLDALETAQRGATAATSEAKGAVDQLRTDLAGLDRRLGEAQAAARAEVAAARDAVRGEVAAARDATRGDLEGVRADLEALRGSLGLLGGRVQALEGLTGAVAALQQGGGSRETAIAQTREAVDALRRDLEQRIAAVGGETERTLAEARERIAADARAAQVDAELALAAFDLRSALERGGTLGPGIALVRDAAQGDAELTALADELAGLEGQGIPTAEQLGAQLEQVAAEVDAPAPGEAPRGVFDVARRNLTGLVDVRPAGAARTGEAAVQQARDALLAGDLAAAEAAIAPLAADSPAARAWLDVEARRKTALAAVDRLAARLKTDLAPQPPAAAR